MGDTADFVEGRIKEAGAALTGNDLLPEEGQGGQSFDTNISGVRRAAEAAADKARLAAETL